MLKFEDTIVPSLIEALRNGDESARNRLIEGYMPNAEKIAEKYFGLGMDDEDVLQAAYEGLILGVDDFRNNQYNNNYQHIIKRIRRQVKEAIAEFVFASSNGFDRRKLINFLNVKKTLALELGREPSIEELANRAGFDVVIVLDLLEKVDRATYGSLDDVDLREVIRRVSCPEDEIISRESKDEVADVLEKVQLTKNERRLLEALLENEMNRFNMARTWRTSFQYIYRLEDSLYDKLAPLLEEAGSSLLEEDDSIRIVEDEKRFVNKRHKERSRNRNRY